MSGEILYYKGEILNMEIVLINGSPRENGASSTIAHNVTSSNHLPRNKSLVFIQSYGYSDSNIYDAIIIILQWKFLIDIFQEASEMF